LINNKIYSDDEWIELFNNNNLNYINYDKVIYSLKSGISDKM